MSIGWGLSGDDNGGWGDEDGDGNVRSNGIKGRERYRVSRITAHRVTK